MSRPDMKRLAEEFVSEAMSGAFSTREILNAVDAALVALNVRAMERAAEVKQAALDLKRPDVESLLGLAMAEYWDDYTMDLLEEGLKLRFPKHHKTVDNIFQWAGDASNEREEMDGRGPTSEYEYYYEKTMKAVNRLPWKKKPTKK